MTEAESLAALFSGNVNAWNEWRKAHDSIRPDLADTDLRGRCLVRANLDDLNLRAADLNSSDLTGASMRRCNLTGANLRGVVAPGADLQSCCLVGADLTSAELQSANLTAADLTGANLSSDTLRNQELRHVSENPIIKKLDKWVHSFRIPADLRGAVLVGARLAGTNLQGACLTGADLTGADVTGASLGGAQLEGAVLRNVEGLTQRQIDSARGDEYTELPGNLEIPASWQTASTDAG